MTACLARACLVLVRSVFHDYFDLVKFGAGLCRKQPFGAVFSLFEKEGGLRSSEALLKSGDLFLLTTYS